MAIASLVVSVLSLGVVGLTAYFVWRYLLETQRIREANEAQLEAQIAPAIIVRSVVGVIELLNLGNGPALHVRLSAAERGSTGNLNLDRLIDDIDFIEARGNARNTGILATPGVPETPRDKVLNGRSLQCQYLSLSGRTYWTVVDFDRADNDVLIATRYRSSLS